VTSWNSCLLSIILTNCPSQFLDGRVIFVEVAKSRSELRRGPNHNNSRQWCRHASLIKAHLWDSQEHSCEGGKQKRFNGGHRRASFTHKSIIVHLYVYQNKCHQFLLNLLYRGMKIAYFDTVGLLILSQATVQLLIYCSTFFLIFVFIRILYRKFTSCLFVYEFTS